MVRVGVEPTQPEAPDLQSGGLTDAQPYHAAIVGPIVSAQNAGIVVPIVADIARSDYLLCNVAGQPFTSTSNILWIGGLQPVAPLPDLPH